MVTVPPSSLSTTRGITILGTPHVIITTPGTILGTTTRGTMVHGPGVGAIHGVPTTAAGAGTADLTTTTAGIITPQT